MSIKVYNRTMIGICDICRYGQTDKCTNPNRDNPRECFVSHTGTTIAEKRIRADTIKDFVIFMQSTNCTDSDYETVKKFAVKFSEQMQKGAEQ